MGRFTTVNHLDIAVSQTDNPIDAWTIYRVDVTNDGSAGNTGGPCPCLGDYPHIGADAYGFLHHDKRISLGGRAISMALRSMPFRRHSLLPAPRNVAMVHFDTTGMVNAKSPASQIEPGFTVWPAQSPSTNSFNLNNGGTEFFLSSNAGEEAAGDAYTGTSPISSSDY